MYRSILCVSLVRFEIGLCKIVFLVNGFVVRKYWKLSILCEMHGVCGRLAWVSIGFRAPGLYVKKVALPTDFIPGTTWLTDCRACYRHSLGVWWVKAYGTRSQWLWLDCCYHAGYWVTARASDIIPANRVVRQAQTRKRSRLWRANSYACCYNIRLS